MKIVFEEFEVNPAATRLVVVTVLEMTKFVKGWIIFDEFIFEIVFPKISDEFTTPNAKLDAFRLLIVFGSRPVTFANWILLIVFPKISEEFTTPNAKLDAFRLLIVFGSRPVTFANWILLRAFPPP